MWRVKRNEIDLIFKWRIHKQKLYTIFRAQISVKAMWPLVVLEKDKFRLLLKHNLLYTSATPPKSTAIKHGNRKKFR